MCTIELEGYETNGPMEFYYRDSAECVAHLFGNPLFVNAMDYSPYRLYDSEEKSTRYYYGVMSAEWSWDAQVSDYQARLLRERLI